MEILDSFKNFIKDRLATPFFVIFITAILIYNYDLFFITFDEKLGSEKQIELVHKENYLLLSNHNKLVSAALLNRAAEQLSDDKEEGDRIKKYTFSYYEKAWIWILRFACPFTYSLVIFLLWEFIGIAISVIYKWADTVKSNLIASKVQKIPSVPESEFIDLKNSADREIRQLKTELEAADKRKRDADKKLHGEETAHQATRAIFQTAEDEKQKLQGELTALKAEYNEFTKNQNQKLSDIKMQLQDSVLKSRQDNDPLSNEAVSFDVTTAYQPAILEFTRRLNEKKYNWIPNGSNSVKVTVSRNQADDLKRLLFQMGINDYKTLT